MAEHRQARHNIAPITICHTCSAGSCLTAWPFTGYRVSRRLSLIYHCGIAIMPPLLFPLPTTSLLTFSNLLIDPSSSYGGALAQATAARTQLHLALKAVADKQPGGSALAVVDVSLTMQSLKKSQTADIRLSRAFCHMFRASQLASMPICYCIKGIQVRAPFDYQCKLMISLWMESTIIELLTLQPATSHAINTCGTSDGHVDLLFSTSQLCSLYPRFITVVRAITRISREASFDTRG
jgi:hypothetical protein